MYNERKIVIIENKKKWGQRMAVKHYLNQVMEKVQEKNQHQYEYLQAVQEFLGTIYPYLEKHPEIMEQNLLSLLIEPERIIEFRVPWQDDQNQWQVNRGYRVQYNSALGPYKGGLRFHPSVNQSIVKFLGFEQIFKNSLTGLPIGGGKGGSDFDPKGKSDEEIMRFCQSFMTELQKYIGPDMDVPAGDIGVGAREIGYLYGCYKRLNGFQAGVLTGKPLLMGGSLARKEATGYGLVYFVDNLLKDLKLDWKDQRVHVSGSGNVAIYTIEKVQQFGGKVYTCSDSNGYIYDPHGIDLDLVKKIKEEKRARISEYVKERTDAVYYSGENVWGHPTEFDIALPCATQNEIDKELAANLVKNQVKIVAEGANMPSNLDAIAVYEENHVIYCPGKAANAGGVAVSALEMSQNSERLSWTFEKVDHELSLIMKNIYETCRDTAKEYTKEYDLLSGANIASFAKVTEAMLFQGLV